MMLTKVTAKKKRIHDDKHFEAESSRFACCPHRCLDRDTQYSKPKTRRPESSKESWICPVQKISRTVAIESSWRG